MSEIIHFQTSSKAIERFARKAGSAFTAMVVGVRTSDFFFEIGAGELQGVLRRLRHSEIF
jgi:hypothetical protein